MASALTFVWDVPATRVDGTALPAAQIAGVEITFGLSGMPSASLGIFPATTTTTTLVDVEPGDYVASKFVMDTQVPAGISAGVAVPVHVEAPRLAVPADGTLTVTVA